MSNGLRTVKIGAAISQERPGADVARLAKT
jgi:hypothetical protein